MGRDRFELRSLQEGVAARGEGVTGVGICYISRISVLYLILLLLFVRSFGLVLRQTGGVHNECHLFGEISKDWPSSILVNILNRSMTSST